tara:strand:- start:3295 stop:3822 length:528 start_codon:yes stop_codon:yes gene_type:complete
MACDLAIGRVEPCKDSVGGLKNLYFVNYGDLGAISYDVTNTDVIDAIAGTPDAYKYEIKGASSFTQNIQSSRDTGTTAFEQVIEVTLKKLTVADHKELKILAYGRPHVIIEDNNGNYFLAGLEHGADVTGGTIVTGTAMSDLSGYTLTLTAMEKAPANFLGDTPTAVGFTVVVGA